MLAVAPMSPEKSAYALARYSRSPDSIRDSIEWVRTHDSAKFLENLYFQYGHASIADLGHLVLCFEGVSELAAAEIEDEQLWDGQARSSRYQDFSHAGIVVSPELSDQDALLYSGATARLLAAYQQIHARMCEHLSEKCPPPKDMKPDVYNRNIAARAFDVARYVLFLGIPTAVGQVTSIRTLEKQIRRLKASAYDEVRAIASEMAAACAAPPACLWDESLPQEPLAPTLAHHLDSANHVGQSRQDLERWALQNLPSAASSHMSDLVDLLRPTNTHAEIVATLLYPVTDLPFRDLYLMASDWSTAQRSEVIEVALHSRTRRDELLREFRSGLYVFDLVIDIGAYRDLHRHRRCQQFRQAYGQHLGYDTPDAVLEAGLKGMYDSLMTESFSAVSRLPGAAAHYLLPFASRSRFLFKMDFAEVEYVVRLRSGVKGHFSYRRVVWEMKRKMDQLEPELGKLVEATPPWVEDPLTR